MAKLKTENSRKCFSILKEFIDESLSTGNKKEIASLALSHLEKITAGKRSMRDSSQDCTYRPRAG